MDELRAAVRDLATASNAAAADLLVGALHRHPPSPELAAFIVQTLEMSALHEVRDTSGVTVRWRLIDRLLDLGFPHALHVSPEDLDYHRARNGRPGLSVLAAFTGVSALLTVLWSFLLGLLFLVMGDHQAGRLRYWLGLAAVGLMFWHAVSAVSAAAKVSRGEPAPVLKTLGWMFFAGPLIALIASQLQHDGGQLALIVGAPAMFTALLCALTAATRRGDDAPSLPLPRIDDRPLDQSVMSVATSASESARP